LRLEDFASDPLAMAAVQGADHDSAESSGHRATATDRNAHVGASLCQASGCNAAQPPCLPASGYDLRIHSIERVRLARRMR
jgi:hypothetical protein